MTENLVQVMSIIRAMCGACTGMWICKKAAEAEEAQEIEAEKRQRLVICEGTSTTEADI
jgi:hypothetical protein